MRASPIFHFLWIVVYCFGFSQSSFPNVVRNTACCSSYDGGLTDIDSSTLYWILECTLSYRSLHLNTCMTKDVSERLAWHNTCVAQILLVLPIQFLTLSVQHCIEYWCTLSYGSFHLNTCMTKDVTERLAWHKSYSFFLFNFYNLHRTGILLSCYVL